MTIDWWTLGFQTVNVGVLIWLLTRFFWRPLATMIALRRTATQLIIDTAQAKQVEAATSLAGISETRAGFAAERAAIIKASRASAEQEHIARMAQSETEASAQIKAGEARLAREAADAERAWSNRASQMAVEIATRLLAPLDGPALRGRFLDRLVQHIRALPVAEREAIAPDGAALVATSAEPLGATEQANNGRAILDALQSKEKITFQVDPALIAGLELRGPHVTVSNSLHADLDRILLELMHDER